MTQGATEEKYTKPWVSVRHVGGRIDGRGGSKLPKLRVIKPFLVFLSLSSPQPHTVGDSSSQPFSVLWLESEPSPQAVGFTTYSLDGGAVKSLRQKACNGTYVTWA